jgi:tRNA-uridine 2-sulfurtransferase
VQGHDHPWLLASTLVAGNTSWVAGVAPEEGAACGAKTRYRQADAPCRFGTAADGRFELRFEEAQWAVTPGQSAVLYQGDVCLGGGIIEHAATALPTAHAGEAALLAAR